MFDAATHRDFLGACLGTGVDRSRVGDILLNGEQGAHVLVVPELAEYLSGHMTSVRPQRSTLTPYFMHTCPASLRYQDWLEVGIGPMISKPGHTMFTMHDRCPVGGSIVSFTEHMHIMQTLKKEDIMCC